MNSSDLEERIEFALTNIRSYLETDGGDVRVVEIKKDTVFIELLGNCGTCPMSAMTLKAGVEEAIKREAPEIMHVEALILIHES